MLRTRMDVSRMAGRLLLQVAASVTATLIGSAIFGTLPNVSLRAGPPTIELTTGGKYAARIPGAATEVAEAVSEPRMAALPAAVAAPMAGLRQPGFLPALDLAWDEGTPIAEPPADKPARGKSRPNRAPEPHRSAESATASISRRPADGPVAAVTARPSGLSAGDGVSLGADDGLLPRVMSSARSVWSITTSAGGSLISHLTP